MTRRLFALLAVCLTFLCTGGASAQTPADYLFTSDVHLNPMADPKLVDTLAAAPIVQWDAIFATGSQTLASFGADTNAPLFHLALAQMKAAVPDPKVVVISGDFLAHNYREQWNASASDYGDTAFYAFVQKSLDYLALEFNAAYPRAQFVITLGNNDSPCGDYAPAPHSAFLAHMAATWAPLVNRDGRAPGFVHDFSDYGQYTATLPGGTRAIAVNSNSWSPAAIRPCDPDGNARSETIGWYERTVAASPSGAKTWVIEHIPPGVDAYAWQQKTAAPFFYATNVLARFRAARAADGKPVGLIVAAHMHNDGFRVVDGSPLLLVPSISPQHANNPSFFVAHINTATSTIADYDAYNLSLMTATASTPFAHEYDFNQTYNVHGFTLDSLAQLLENIHDHTNGMRDIQAAHFVAGSPIKAITPQNWQIYWCSYSYLDVPSFSACLRRP